MGKLANPGAGDLSDRLTILALKILNGQLQKKDISHFEAERNILLTQIRARTLNGKWFENVLGLGAVNAVLWDTEDVLRDCRVTWDRLQVPDSTGLTFADDKERTLLRAGEAAMRSQWLNDRRADLIQQINRDAGDGGEPEKVR